MSDSTARPFVVAVVNPVPASETSAMAMGVAQRRPLKRTTCGTDRSTASLACPLAITRGDR
eukprot:15466961-Alexandrium_andersonii.AAC.1